MEQDNTARQWSVYGARRTALGRRGMIDILEHARLWITPLWPEYFVQKDPNVSTTTRGKILAQCGRRGRIFRCRQDHEKSRSFGNSLTCTMLDTPTVIRGVCASFKFESPLQSNHPVRQTLSASTLQKSFPLPLNSISRVKREGYPGALYSQHFKNVRMKAHSVLPIGDNYNKNKRQIGAEVAKGRVYTQHGRYHTQSDRT